MPDLNHGGRPAGCPSEDALAAYLDGACPADRRADISAHLAHCDRCYELVAEVMHAQEADASAGVDQASVGEDDDAPPAPLPWPRRRAMVMATAGLAAAAALVVAVLIPGATPYERRISGLVDAVGEERIYEGRLTGGFQYGPLRTPTRSAAAPYGDNMALAAAAGDLQKRAQADPSASNLHAFAVAALLVGSVDQAVATLENAAAAGDPQAGLQSDLAAAYIARARNAGRDDDWPRAVQAAETALELDPSLREASYNRAVALTGLGLREQAMEAWRQYLQLDPGSPWAEAARAELAKLQSESRLRVPDDLAAAPRSVLESVAGANAQRLREHVEDALMPAWAHAVAANDGAAAAAALARAQEAAEVLKASVGDELPLQSVLAAASGACPAADHAKAWLLWEQGRREYARDGMARMTAAFRDASAMFERCASPQAYWARHYVVVGTFYAGLGDQAQGVLDGIAADIAGHPYPALKARLSWDAGTIAFQRARFEAAMAAYNDAHQQFGLLAEPENEAAVSQLLAEAYARLGQYGRSWQQSRRAIEQISIIRDPRRRYSMLAGAGTVALNQDLPQAAIRLFKEALPHAYAFGAAGAIVGTHQNLARALCNAGDLASASTQIGEARRYLSSIGDPGLAARFGADLVAADAQLTLKSDPAAAVTLADRAIEMYRSISSEYRLASLHLVRGRGKRATGDLAGAASALDEGLKYLESTRALSTQIELRVSYVDTVWDLYGDVIHLHAVDLGRPMDGLVYAERARARTLLESSAGAATAPMDPSTVARMLREGEIMLYLSTHEEETLAWTLDGRGARAFNRLPVGRHDADRLVSHLRDALQGGRDDDALALSRQVWTRLIAPLRPSLQGALRLIIVADAHWQQLPFACLQDPSTGRFLVEDVALVMAPSATFYSARARQPEPRPRGLAAAVFVAPGSDEASGLRPLPGAIEEAHDVASKYAAPAVFAKADATPRRMLEALAEFDVVHFAGHAVADPMSPWLSRLVLNPDAGGRASLTARDIAGVQARARVVVLSACRTADGAMSRAEGLMSLARPFVAAGVQSVVATLWDVQDHQASGLSERFHGELIQAHDAAVALQRAQVAALGRNRHTALGAWSAYVVVGA